MDGSVLGWLQHCKKYQGFGNFESLDFFTVRSVLRLPATFLIAHVWVPDRAKSLIRLLFNADFECILDPQR